MHFCRFVFKLLQRINHEIDGKISESVRDKMHGIIFMKLKEVSDLKTLDKNKAGEYKKTVDFQKICQIVDQYQKKYEKEINSYGKWNGYEGFQNELAEQIKSMFYDVKENDIEGSKEKVIILDYLITLRQLLGLLAKEDVQLFHNKSKI